uniref:Uncharacterized protein n=2 Tax=Timema TaxID=61471 RepID=A0A7R9K1P8_TIMGE|nr:unnamed protein product [Timema genevievae]
MPFLSGTTLSRLPSASQEKKRKGKRSTYTPELPEKRKEGMRGRPNSSLEKAAILGMHPQTGLPRIQIDTNIGSFTTVIDFSASTSFIKTSILDPQTKQQIHLSPMKIRLANMDTELYVTGSHNISIKVGRFYDKVRCLVAEELSEDLLLGHDWLVKNEAVLDYQSNLMCMSIDNGSDESHAPSPDGSDCEASPRKKYRKREFPKTEIKTRGAKLPNFALQMRVNHWTRKKSDESIDTAEQNNHRDSSRKVVTIEKKLDSHKSISPVIKEKSLINNSSEKSVDVKPRIPSTTETVDLTENQTETTALATHGLDNMLHLHSNPLTWTKDEVYQFLTSTDCVDLADKCKEQLIDGHALMLLNLPTIQEYLCVKTGAALKLCHLIEKIKKEGRKEVQSPPRIVKQPPTDELLFQVVQQQNENDKPFIIECEAEGEPAPKYRWIKNGKHFDWQAYDNRISQQPGRGTLVISSPRDEDLGQYQCFAENEWGIATSNSVYVRKAELNSFKDELPVTVTAPEGKPFKLTCQPPDGWPKPNVYWLIQNTDGGIKSINNSRMTLDPEGNLWFSNVTRLDASDDFVYACAATSFFRNEYKLGNRVMLNVMATGVSSTLNRHEPTKQYVTRKNEVALRGKKVEMYCIYGGTPLPQTVWNKDGQPIHSSDRTSQGNYGKSLLIKHVDFEDQGSYTCEVSNGVGSAQSYSINLKVNAAPYFTLEPEIINAAEDETVEFRCEASGEPKPQIKWIRNGVPIEEAPPNPRRKVTPNRIIIERLDKTDTANYGCNATNSIGYVYKDVYVNVLALGPDITEPPKDEATVDGRKVTLLCRVFGAPKPLVKWIHNGKEVTGGRYTVLESGDLEIRDVNFFDEGQYTCYAENKFGNAEASGSLVVKEHTKITDEPEDYEVAAGTTATFRCNAVSDSSLDLTIDWLNNGQEIDFESEPRFVKSSDYSLTITKTTELDSGTYTCVAKTELDEATAQATLTVQAVMLTLTDVPNSPRLEGITCNKRDANIKWSPMGDNRAPILHYIIQYNTSFTPDSWEDAYDNVPATDMTYTVGMSPWANYTFRVIALNKIGPSTPSPHSAVCTTQPDVPYKNPDNVMPEIEHNAPRFMYRVYWKRDIPGEQWQSNDIMDWKQNKLVIPNQPTFQQYRIKVVAINEKGEANVSPKEEIGYSGEDVPTQAPQDFRVEQVTNSNSALLSWSPVPEDSIRGHFMGYKIQTWTEKEGEEGMREIDVKSKDTRSLINKFIPHSKNFARVLAYNGRYNGPPSDTVNFDTLEGVPGTVQFFEAFPMGSSALYLVWKRPEQPNGILTGYRIYYQTVRDTSVGPLIERQAITDPKQTRAKLAGLQPGMKYRLHIKATTRAGEGEDYFIEQRTRASATAIPDKPKFTWHRIPTENGYATVKVVWLPNVEGKLGSHFFVKYKLKAETIYTESKAVFTEDFTEIRGLMPGEVYEFIVVAVDGDQMTESEPEEVETHSVGLPRLYRRSISISLELNAINTTRCMPIARPCSGAPRRTRAVRFVQTHLANSHCPVEQVRDKQDLEPSTFDKKVVLSQRYDYLDLGPLLNGGGVEDLFRKSHPEFTQKFFERAYLPVTSIPDYCKCDTLDHATMEGRVKVVRALYKYTAQNPDELSFQEGDLLYVFDEVTDSNWWKARCGTETGLIPSNYVENHTEEMDCPLHEAARRGNLVFLRECLHQGVSGTGLDQTGSTPLYWASHGGHLHCVAELLNLPNPAVNAQNKVGETPLHVAASRGHYEVVETLLKQGADSRIPNKDGQTALELAMNPAVINSIQQSRSLHRTSITAMYNANDYADDSD